MPEINFTGPLMRIIKIIIISIPLSIFFNPSVEAQDITGNTFGEGIRIAAADSTFTLKFTARIQSRYQLELNSRTNEYTDGFQIRRARLKFDGFAYSPRLAYKIELAVANSDITSGSIPQSGKTANIMLDAVVKWNFAGKWNLWFGQTKLPGNRERVISSQALQFVDRSNLNSRFNLDRDAGVQLHYDGRKIKLAGAVSMGEGRNIIDDNHPGYGYTARAEFLPFGKFTDKGDYFSADLAREPSPRLSLGIAYDHNSNATRERGRLGDFMTEERDLNTLFADAHFKYSGFSSLVEYAHRETTGTPVVHDAEGNFADAFYTGYGISAQAGYLFRNNFEIAGRYTSVVPELITNRTENTQYTLGLSKYFAGHSLKLQTDVSLITEAEADDLIVYRLQVELGF